MEHLAKTFLFFVGILAGLASLVLLTVVTHGWFITGMLAVAALAALWWIAHTLAEEGF